MTIYWSGSGSNQVSGYFYEPRGGIGEGFLEPRMPMLRLLGSIAWNSRIRLFFFFFLSSSTFTYTGCRWHLARVYHHCALCIASLNKRSRASSVIGIKIGLRQVTVHTYDLPFKLRTHFKIIMLHFAPAVL